MPKIIEEVVQKTVEMPQFQYVNRIIDVLVEKRVKLPVMLEVSRHVDVPQNQCIDKVMYKL